MDIFTLWSVFVDQALIGWLFHSAQPHSVTSYDSQQSLWVSIIATKSNSRQKNKLASLKNASAKLVAYWLTLHTRFLRSIPKPLDILALSIFKSISFTAYRFFSGHIAETNFCQQKSNKIHSMIYYLHKYICTIFDKTWTVEHTSSNSKRQVWSVISSQRIHLFTLVALLNSNPYECTQ